MKMYDGVKIKLHMLLNITLEGGKQSASFLPASNEQEVRQTHSWYEHGVKTNTPDSCHKSNRNHPGHIQILCNYAIPPHPLLCSNSQLKSETSDQPSLLHCINSHTNYQKSSVYEHTAHKLGLHAVHPPESQTAEILVQQVYYHILQTIKCAFSLEDTV